MYPIFIPIRTEPTRCPHCHKPEDKQEVCRHCAYVYPEDGDSTSLSLGWATIIGAIGGFVFLSDRLALGNPQFMDYLMATVLGAVLGVFALGALALLWWLFGETYKRLVNSN